MTCIKCIKLGSLLFIIDEGLAHLFHVYQLADMQSASLEPPEFVAIQQSLTQTARGVKMLDEWSCFNLTPGLFSHSSYSSF